LTAISRQPHLAVGWSLVAFSLAAGKRRRPAAAPEVAAGNVSVSQKVDEAK
jgi:hypothetical protein